MHPQLLAQLKKITPEEEEILNGRADIDSSLYNLNRSMVVDSRKLLEAGKLIELRTHTRFIHFPKHTHNYVEVVYMCSGSTRHIVDGTEIILKEGELLFLSQFAVQEIFRAGKDDIAVNLIILPEFFDQVLSIIGTEESLIRTFLTDCLRNSRRDISYLHFQVSDVLPVQNLMENLIDTLLRKTSNRRRLNQNTFALLFLHLMEHTGQLAIGKDHVEEELTLQVFRYIEEHYHDGSLTALSEELHCSLYQISKIIRRTTGQTYKELLQQKRLHQAAFLLSTTTLSVNDISMDVGYNNFTYFYRIFKDQYKMTPREYRKRSTTHES